ncbi:hypothetical protein vseg_001047 [Gypsophila vaccaria]
MMNTRSRVVCGGVVFLGLVSTLLGFVSEAKRTKESQVKMVSADGCTYPRSPAYGLGITAAFCLLLSHIIITVEAGCLCCRRHVYTSTIHWVLSILCYIVSWFTFVVAFLLLLGGAALNDNHEAEQTYGGFYQCYIVASGVFAVASVLAFASVTLSILYYLTISSAKTVDSPFSSTTPNQGGIAMGHPQVPPISHDPVFVHEDTYTRRQFT